MGADLDFLVTDLDLMGADLDLMGADLVADLTHPPLFFLVTLFFLRVAIIYNHHIMLQIINIFLNLVNRFPTKFFECIIMFSKCRPIISR